MRFSQQQQRTSSQVSLLMDVGQPLTCFKFIKAMKDTFALAHRWAIIWHDVHLIKTSLVDGHQVPICVISNTFIQTSPCTVSSVKFLMNIGITWFAPVVTGRSFSYHELIGSLWCFNDLCVLLFSFYTEITLYIVIGSWSSSTTMMTELLGGFDDITTYTIIFILGIFQLTFQFEHLDIIIIN